MNDKIPMRVPFSAVYVRKPNPPRNGDAQRLSGRALGAYAQAACEIAAKVVHGGVRAQSMLRHVG